MRKSCVIREGSGFLNSTADSTQSANFSEPAARSGGLEWEGSYNMHWRGILDAGSTNKHVIPARRSVLRFHKRCVQHNLDPANSILKAYHSQTMRAKLFTLRQPVEAFFGRTRRTRT